MSGVTGHEIHHPAAGVGYTTILDALALVHTGSRANRPVQERAYNICSDLGLVAATLVHGGLEAVEAIQVRPGNPVRPMLAQRMSSAAELLAKGLGPRQVILEGEVVAARASPGQLSTVDS